MAKPVVARFRNFNLTQSAADAFVQTEEATGINASDGYCWLLDKLEMYIPQSVSIQAIAADCSIHWAITRSTRSSMPSIEDSGCIAAGGVFHALTTSGVLTQTALMEYKFPEGILVVEPEVYFQLDSTGTGQTIIAHGRLYYQEVKLSEVDVLRMLTQGM